MTPNESTRRRAARLLRWYPRGWRSRYGVEFVELLTSEMEERPKSLRRGFDVALSGVVARFAAAGLGGQPLDHHDSERHSLVAIGGALTIFVVFACAIWSQLTIGWQWSAPDTPATSWAMVVMSASVVALGALCIGASIPVLSTIGRGFARGLAREILRPLLIAIASVGFLLVGSHHFANGWPGTGAHAWSSQGIVPGGVAAFAWASTLSVSSYWAHPTALMDFPTAEVVWMLMSPVAVLAAIVGSANVVRQLEFSSRVLRCERRLALAATLVMAAFVTGAAMWVFDGGPGPRNLFHIGAIDLVDLMVMAAALAMAGRAVRTMGQRSPSLSTR